MSMLRYAVLLPAATMLFSCASWLSTRNEIETTENPVRAVQRYCTFDPVTAFGSIRASSGGEVVSGSIEVHYAGTSATRIILYSPLGAIVGSMVTRNDSLVMEFGDHRQTLALSDPFTSELLPWGGSFRCDEVVQFMCGRMIYCDSLEMRQPTEIIPSALRTCYKWKSSGWECAIFVTRWRRRLRRIEFKKWVDTTTVYHLRLSSFTGDGARRIMMKVDDRNYFSVEYERFLRK